jgi:hypothetical protein
LKIHFFYRVPLKNSDGKGNKLKLLAEKAKKAEKGTSDIILHAG